MEDYDNLHKLWARAHSAGSPIKFVRNAVVFRELDRLMPGNTLDAGCGTGDYSLFLSERGHRVTAFDPSPFAIKKLLERCRKTLSIEAEINTIEGFHSSKLFDNIISIEVIEHIEFDQTALQKLYIFLKKGGSILISVPASPFLYSEADRVSGHYRRYSSEEFMKLFTNVGFSNIQIKRYGFPILFFYSLMRKLFLDKILLRYFTSSSLEAKKEAHLFAKIYPLILIIDQLNVPFGSVGYVAKCKK